MRWWWLTCAAGLGLFLLLDLLAEGHEGGWWTRIPAFFSLYGLLGCIAIIVLSKLLGSYWLQRSEDYYERERSDE